MRSTALAAAICDRDTTTLGNAATDHPGASVYSEFEQMLDDAQMDVLFVETPATHHGEFCVGALDRG